MATMLTQSGNVQAYCKVCKAVVEHAVVAVIRDRPQRVECRICEDAHPYRDGPPSPKKAATKPVKRTRVASAGVSYDNLMQGRDPSQATAYGMDLQFGDSDLIAHTTFGVGLVTRVLVNHKIEVMFPQGLKLLAHER